MLRSSAASFLGNFIKYTFPGYMMGWFHLEICKALEMFLTSVVMQKSPRLIITAPPQSGKSEIISRRFPAYILGKFPDINIISTSYSADLALRMSKDVQMVMTSPAFGELFPLVKLAEKGVIDGKDYSKRADFFQIVNAKGSYRAAGVGGGITGMGGECVEAGSLISTPCREVLVESLRVGDEVLSYNHESKLVESKRVIAVRALGADSLCKIKAEDDLELRCTPEHLVWSDDGYKQADSLVAGSPLLRLWRGGYLVRTNEIGQKVTCPAKVISNTVDEHKTIVYDIQVEDNYNFFANNILVHNCILIDDPIKDHEEADSFANRQKIWDWYTSTLYTRQRPGAGIVIVHTRWHEDDLVGRLLEKQKTNSGDAWQVLNFPAIAERDEEHRKKGEALHPERYSLEELERKKEVIGSRDWSALYQQHPAPDEGQIFKREWFKYWTKEPDKFDKIILSWDMAFKDTKSSDYVVGQVWGKKGAECYLLDQVRGQMGFVGTCEAFQKQAREWPKALTKLVEDKANGPAVIDALKRKIQGIISVQPDGSKVSRAFAITALFEAGNVYFPSKRIYPWVDDLENELLTFPSAMHDDQVDALTQALRRLARSTSMFSTAPENVYINNDWEMSW
jgi:predicted phage terminase large subunit-like protein